MRLILSHHMEFEILGELPKSIISDFGLEGGKTLYKDYIVDSS